MSDVDPTPDTPITIGDRIAWLRGDIATIIERLDTLIDATQYSTQVLLQIKDPVNQPPTSFDWTTAIRVGNWNNIGTFNLDESTYQAYMPIVQSPIGSGSTQIHRFPVAPPNLDAWLGSTFQGNSTAVHIGWNFTDWKVTPRIMLFNHDLSYNQYGLFLKDDPNWYEIPTYPNMVSDIMLDTFYTHQPVSHPANIIASIMFLFPVGFSGKPALDIWFDTAH